MLPVQKDGVPSGEVVSMSMTKNVIIVVGFTTFSGLIGALIRLQIWSMAFKFCWYSDDPAGPAVRKSFRVTWGYRWSHKAT